MLIASRSLTLTIVLISTLVVGKDMKTQKERMEDGLKRGGTGMTGRGMWYANNFDSVSSSG